MQNVHPSQINPSYTHTETAAQAYPNSCDHTQSPTYLHDQNQYQTPTASYAYASPEEAGLAYPQPNAITNWYNFSDGSYLKGFLVGAGVTLLVTNPTVQKSIVKGAVKIWSLFQGGVEEVKEQIQDVKAEMSQK